MHGYTLLMLCFTPLYFYFWNCLISSILSKLKLMNYLTETCIYSQKTHVKFFYYQCHRGLFQADSCKLIYIFSAKIMYDLHPTATWKGNHFKLLWNLYKNEKKSYTTLNFKATWISLLVRASTVRGTANNATIPNYK